MRVVLLLLVGCGSTATAVNCPEPEPAEPVARLTPPEDEYVELPDALAWFRSTSNMGSFELDVSYNEVINREGSRIEASAEAVLECGLAPLTRTHGVLVQDMECIPKELATQGRVTSDDLLRLGDHWWVYTDGGVRITDSDWRRNAEIEGIDTLDESLVWMYPVAFQSTPADHHELEELEDNTIIVTISRCPELPESSPIHRSDRCLNDVWCTQRYTRPDNDRIELTLCLSEQTGLVAIHAHSELHWQGTTRTITGFVRND